MHHIRLLPAPASFLRWARLLQGLPFGRPCLSYDWHAAIKSDALPSMGAFWAFPFVGHAVPMIGTAMEISRVFRQLAQHLHRYSFSMYASLRITPTRSSTRTRFFASGSHCTVVESWRPGYYIPMVHRSCDCNLTLFLELAMASSNSHWVLLLIIYGMCFVRRSLV